MLPFRFYLITDRLHARHDARSLLPSLVRAGLSAVQVREKDLAPRALADYCRALLAAVGDAGALHMYLNDRADLALSLGLHGVHLREDSLPLAEHAPALREPLSCGVSTHSLAGVQAAAEAGADFATFGPVYATASKTAFGAPLGPQALAQAAAATPLPLLALGGVTPLRVAECLAAGAAGVAAISAIWNADDPLAELARFAEALGGLGGKRE